ncbi:MAG: kynureninase [Flammeovirgaceae bacterium]
MMFENTLSFAKRLDQQDPLKKYRSQFHFPVINGKRALYFTGNSLGLQPASTKKFVTEELTDWAKLGVEGHFHARRPWLYYHHYSKKTLAKLVGAKPMEVVAMNQLTVNLHLMLASFYRPTPTRYKILTEAGAFSSDQYAFETHLKFHGINPDLALIELKPRPNEHTLRTDDIIQAIEDHADELAVVIFGAVQYYTGQFFDIKRITEAGHRAGAMVGFDLAHAIGNVPLQLHKHNVDFAVWCSYKYLNSGPGGVAGAYVHERHGNNTRLTRLAGWWGHLERERFQMKKGFIPMPGIDGWQLSNFPVLSGSALMASLDIFEKVGMRSLRRKSEQLTAYLEFILKDIDPSHAYFSVITPSQKTERGCQLSVLMQRNGKKIFDRITKAGVIADWREPDVIRIAPVPLYNSFEDVYRLGEILKHSLK